MAHDDSNKDKSTSKEITLKQDTVSLKTRAGFGLVAGLVSSIVGALIIFAINAAELVRIPWFVLLGALFSDGLPVELSIDGLILFLGFGTLCGLLFAALFLDYTVTKGLAFGGLQLLSITVLLAVISTSTLSGTLLNLPLQDVLRLLVSLSIAYVGYGATLGETGRILTSEQ
jgi:hypothetical protein